MSRHDFKVGDLVRFTGDVTRTWPDGKVIHAPDVTWTVYSVGGGAFDGMETIGIEAVGWLIHVFHWEIRPATTSEWDKETI